MSHEVDETDDHEDRMQVELLRRILLPGEWKRGSIRRVESDHPEENEADDAVQEDLGDEDEEGQAASRAAGHLVIVVFAMPETKENVCQFFGENFVFLWLVIHGTNTNYWQFLALLFGIIANSGHYFKALLPILVTK